MIGARAAAAGIGTVSAVTGMRPGGRPRAGAAPPPPPPPPPAAMSSLKATGADGYRYPPDFDPAKHGSLRGYRAAAARGGRAGGAGGARGGGGAGG